MVHQQLNFIVSVIPKSDNVLDRLDEAHILKNELGKKLYELGYDFIVGGEDVMSDYANQRIIPIKEN
jgi:hypothetical protein